MKRITCAVLAMMLCLGVFAGCAKKPTPLPPMEEIPVNEWIYSRVDPIPTKKLPQEIDDKLHRGMTLEEVEEILGKGQWEEAKYDTIHKELDVVYFWVGVKGQGLSILFHNEEASSVQICVNLKENDNW